MCEAETDFKNKYLQGSTPVSGDTLVRKGLTVTITKPEGVYTIIYGAHNAAQDPELLPGKFDAIALETGGTPWSDNPLGYLNNYKKDIQYGKLFERLEKDHIPILFMDTFHQFSKNSEIDYWVANLIDSGIVIGETLIGGQILFDLAKDVKNHRFSRRSFLRTTAMAAAGGWLSSPFISITGEATSVFGNIGTETTTEAMKTIQRTHPESMFLLAKVRNVAEAYKKQRLMELWGNKPHIVDVWGMDHVGIEDEIMAPLQAKYDFLKKISPLLKLIALPTFYRTAKFDYDGANWKIGIMYEFPELKELATRGD